MGILGKILLVLNLLALGGFGFLAVQDWKGRQTIAAAGIRHVLLVNGLPLDGGTDPVPPRVAAGSDDFADFAATELPFRVEVGPKAVETISPELLYVYFAAAGAGAPGAGGIDLAGAGAPGAGGIDLAGPAPVTSQLAEVRRVYALVKAHVDGLDGAAKASAAAGFLLLQAESIEDRTEYQTLLAARNGDELARRLYLRFDRVLNPPALPDLSALTPENTLAKATELRSGGVKDEHERRVRAAHLLVHLDSGAGWQKRTMLVVGLKRYVRTVVEQTLRFRDMAARVEQQAAADQDRFVGEYAQLRGLAIEKTQIANNMRQDRARLEQQVQKDEEFVELRQTQLKELQDQLAKLKAEVDLLLARQYLTEQQLFEVQREVGLTLEAIYGLEADLGAKERARYGAK